MLESPLYLGKCSYVWATSGQAYDREVLLCLTASHKTATFDLLERLSRTPENVDQVLLDAVPAARGTVVVSTCNRVEAYVDYDETVADITLVDTLSAALAESAGVDTDALNGAFAIRTGDRVVEHLFAVASGLESVVSGEGEIAGQVRDALKTARAQGTTSTELERLFQKASQAQRKVKNVTALQRAGRSLVRLSLELANSRITDWSAERILLIGTGSYAAVTLAALRERGAQRISVYSPSGRQEAFAEKYGLFPVDPAHFAHGAAAASLIITCTNAEGFVLDRSHIEAGLSAHPLRALAPTETVPGACPVSGGPIALRRRLIIDLGMPRNVNPDVNEIEGVALLDLEVIKLHAPLEELQAADNARAVVRDAARDFRTAGARQQVTPAVVALRSHIFELLEAEIDRARARGDEDGRVEQAMRHLAGVLLHTPTMRANDLADQGRAHEFAAALETLYGVRAAEASDTAASA